MEAPSTTPSPALRAWLVSTTLADVANAKHADGKAPPLAAIESDEPIANLLTLLASRRVLSAPVVVRATGDPPGSAALAHGGVPVKAVAGFASAADVLDAVLKEVTTAGGGPATATAAALSAAAGAVCARPVGSLLVDQEAGAATVGAAREATAGRDWGLVHGAPRETSLLDALAFSFFRPCPCGGGGGGGGAAGGDAAAAAAPPRARLPVHRLGVTDGSGSALVGVLSQSDAVAALAAAPASAWGGAAAAAVDALAPPTRPAVVSVPATATALEAFRAMRAAGVPGVAVVHPETGALVAHLSSSDARCLSAPTFAALALPVLDFLAERRLLEHASLDSAGGAGGVADAVARAAGAGVALVGGGPGGRAGRLLDAVPGLGLRAAAAALAASRCHQLYEVDPGRGGAPVRVVSMSDVLAAVLAAAGGAPE